MLSKPVAQRCRLNENFGIDESFRWPVLAEGAVSGAIRRECIARMPTLFRGLLSRIEDLSPSSLLSRAGDSWSWRRIIVSFLRYDDCLQI